MQYQRHNFTHNFLNAVGTDQLAAWDILINDINEIVLDSPKEVEKAVRDAGLRLHSNPSPKDLVDVIHDGIYVNDQLSGKLLQLIARRHANPYYSADGGKFDKLLIDGQVSTDYNIDGDLLNDDGELLNIMGSGIKRMVQNVKSKVGTAINKQKTKQMMDQNLESKERQRNLPVSKSKSTMPPMVKTGLYVAAAVAVVGLVAFLIYKSKGSDSSSTEASPAPTV